MITAKNYAAQAEVALINASKRHIVGGRKDYAEYILALARGIRHGVKFVIPDGGLILDDNLRGIISTPVRLPFEVTVIEFAVTPYASKPDHYTMHKVVILCVEFGEDGDFKIHPMMYLMGAGESFWMPCAYEAVVPFEDQLQLKEDGRVAFKTTIISSGALVDGIGTGKEHVHKEVVSKCIESTYELLEALTCTNIEQSIYQPASPKNAQRIKSHKAPIYETRCLTLKTTKKESFGGGDGASSHKSPKQHLRRGHIRRLEKGNIWVNSCVVGDASNGIIDKYYKIKK